MKTLEEIKNELQLMDSNDMLFLVNSLIQIVSIIEHIDYKLLKLEEKINDISKNNRMDRN